MDFVAKVLFPQQVFKTLIPEIVEVEKRKSGEREGIYIRGCLGQFKFQFVVEIKAFSGAFSYINLVTGPLIFQTAN